MDDFIGRAILGVIALILLIVGNVVVAGILQSMPDSIAKVILIIGLSAADLVSFIGILFFVFTGSDKFFNTL